MNEFGIVLSCCPASCEFGIVLSCRLSACCSLCRPVSRLVVLDDGTLSSRLSAGRGAEKMTAPPCALASMPAVIPRPFVMMTIGGVEGGYSPCLGRLSGYVSAIHNNMHGHCGFPCFPIWGISPAMLTGHCEFPCECPLVVGVAGDMRGRWRGALRVA